MPVAPKLKSSELVDRLRHLKDGPEYEFAFRSIERDAEKLIEAGERAGGWMVKGMVATHRFDEAATRDAFKNAINYSHGDLAIEQNFVRALHILGQSAEAFERALPLIDRDGADIDFLRTVARIALRAGAFHAAAELAERVRLLKADPGQDVEPLIRVLTREGVSDEEVRARAAVVASVVRDKGVRIRGVEWEASSEVEPVGVTYTVDAGPAETAELNVEIADALCERFADPLARAVVFDCRPAR